MFSEIFLNKGFLKTIHLTWKKNTAKGSWELRGRILKRSDNFIWRLGFTVWTESVCFPWSVSFCPRTSRSTWMKSAWPTCSVDRQLYLRRNNRRCQHGWSLYPKFRELVPRMLISKRIYLLTAVMWTIIGSVIGLVIILIVYPEQRNSLDTHLLSVQRIHSHEQFQTKNPFRAYVLLLY